MKIVAAVVVCLTKGDPIGLPPAATVFPGLPLAAKFGLDDIYETTPYFNSWLEPTAQSEMTTQKNAIRSYSNLSLMFRTVYDTAEWDRIQGYGCYCINSSMTNQMSHAITQGYEPIDELDRHCWKYTQCIKCAKQDHGDWCTPEQINYWLKLKSSNEIVCKNSYSGNETARCKRKLCECDKFLVDEYKDYNFHYNPEYHFFNGFSISEDCSSKTKGGVTDESNTNSGSDTNTQSQTVQSACCGSYPHVQSFFEGTTDDKVCCDGEIVGRNSCSGTIETTKDAEDALV